MINLTSLENDFDNKSITSTDKLHNFHIDTFYIKILKNL